MTDDSLWGSLWDTRLQRSTPLMLATLALAVGLNFAVDEHLRWGLVVFTTLLLEVLVVIGGDPNSPALTPGVLRRLRHASQRLLAYGILAAAAGFASLAQFTAPVATLPLLIMIGVIEAGGIAVVLGMLMLYVSRVRDRVRRRPKPVGAHVRFFICAAPILWAGYEVITRAQRTGVWEPLRLFGLLLIAAASVVAVLNPPAWMLASAEESTP
jgi:hypothetical protein